MQQRRFQLLLTVNAVAFLAIVTALLYENSATAQPADGQVPTKELAGFTIKQVRFDESMGTKKPTPQIPKSWRFIAVSNGQGTNSNNVWFQDEDGTIYIVRGFSDGDDFILRQSLQKLEVK
jgi:hypothetical protein